MTFSDNGHDPEKVEEIETEIFSEEEAPATVVVDQIVEEKCELHKELDQISKTLDSLARRDNTREIQANLINQIRQRVGRCRAIARQ